MKTMLWSVALLTLFAGCGSSDLPVATTHGTVTHQGKLLDNGLVVFFPEPGVPGPQAVGQIESDGTFRMGTIGRDGAAIGWHRATVHSSGPIQPVNQDQGRMPPQPSLIPVKYSVMEDSPLRFEVKEGDNEYQITLE